MKDFRIQFNCRFQLSFICGNEDWFYIPVLYILVFFFYGGLRYYIYNRIIKSAVQWYLVDILRNADPVTWWCYKYFANIVGFAITWTRKLLALPLVIYPLVIDGIVAAVIHHLETFPAATCHHYISPKTCIWVISDYYNHNHDIGNMYQSLSSSSVTITVIITLILIKSGIFKPENYLLTATCCVTAC